MKRGGATVAKSAPPPNHNPIETFVVRMRQADIAFDTSPRPSAASSTDSAYGRTEIVKMTQPIAYAAISNPASATLFPAESCTTCERNNSAGGMLISSGGRSSHARYRRVNVMRIVGL